MQPNDPVLIRPVDNGFIVTPGMGTSTTEYVFQTFAELQNFLRDHFTWRMRAVITDGRESEKS